MKSICIIDEWKKHGLKEGVQFATLTDIIYKTWAGKTAKEYKEFKGLKKENLRDNMTNKELVLNMLAEVTTTAMSKEQKPNTMAGHKQVARQGGEVAKTAKIAYEQRVGKKAISPLNADNKNLLEIKSDEDK